MTIMNEDTTLLNVNYQYIIEHVYTNRTVIDKTMFDELIKLYGDYDDSLKIEESYRGRLTMNVAFTLLDLFDIEPDDTDVLTFDEDGMISLASKAIVLKSVMNGVWLHDIEDSKSFGISNDTVIKSLHNYKDIDNDGSSRVPVGSVVVNGRTYVLSINKEEAIAYNLTNNSVVHHNYVSDMVNSMDLLGMLVDINTVKITATYVSDLLDIDIDAIVDKIAVNMANIKTLQDEIKEVESTVTTMFSIANNSILPTVLDKYGVDEAVIPNKYLKEYINGTITIDGVVNLMKYEVTNE